MPSGSRSPSSSALPGPRSGTWRHAWWTPAPPGLALFNRVYQPDIDLETRAVTPHLELSTPQEQLLPLRWTILHGRLETSLGVTAGGHDATGVAKALLAGADVAMMASAILRHGPDVVRSTLVELTGWMDEHGYASVAQLRGSASQQAVTDPDAFEQANYLKTLASWAGPARHAGLFPA